jgi:hypothetical protein
MSNDQDHFGDDSTTRTALEESQNTSQEPYFSLHVVASVLVFASSYKSTSNLFGFVQGAFLQKVQNFFQTTSKFYDKIE